MKRTLIIEGFPVCFGEGEKPDWFEGDKIDCLAPIDKRPSQNKTIDPLGGVENQSDMQFVPV